MKSKKTDTSSLDEALKLGNQLCFPLYAASRKIINAYTPILKPLGITYTQFIVFMVLWENDNLAVGEIGARLHLDNGTLTPLLKKMEKEGYISRKRSPQDERTVIISLTKDGLKMKDKARDIPKKIKNCVNLSSEDAGELYRILYQLIDGE
ncbi:MAG TPA: MarR family transcriptional regulator [Lachnospiraceae bacterium]|nr:MarR family transcriptional regulator [Lachnospiraceae bacterium]